MDIGNMMAEMLVKQREFVKSRYEDHQIHCEICNAIVRDNEPYFLIKQGWFKFKTICENCKQLGRK